jgi:hypothetical protein
MISYYLQITSLYLQVYHCVIFTVTWYHTQPDFTLIAPVIILYHTPQPQSTWRPTLFFGWSVMDCQKLILLTLVPARLGLPTTEETGQFENFSVFSIKQFIKRNQKSRWEHWHQHADSRNQPLMIVRSQEYKKRFVIHFKALWITAQLWPFLTPCSILQWVLSRHFSFHHKNFPLLGLHPCNSASKLAFCISTQLQFIYLWSSLV